MSSTASQVLVACFAALEAEDIPAAILHGYEHMPQRWDSDADFVVPAGALHRLPTVLGAAAEREGWQLVDVIEANLSALYVVLAGREHPERTMQLDICADYVERHHRLLPAALLLAGVRKQGRLP